LAGNELSGSGVGTSIKADQYASDFATLRDIVYNEYREIDSKPLVMAPGGFFDATWFREFISKCGKALDVVTHHIYNLGPGTPNRTGKYSLYLPSFHNLIIFEGCFILMYRS